MDKREYIWGRPVTDRGLPKTNTNKVTKKQLPLIVKKLKEGNKHVKPYQWVRIRLLRYKPNNSVWLKFGKNFQWIMEIASFNGSNGVIRPVNKYWAGKALVMLLDPSHQIDIIDYKKGGD